MEDQEEDNEGHGDDHDGGHHGGDVLPAETVLADFLNAVGDQEIGLVVCDQARPDIRIPAFNDLEDRNGDDGGLTDGHHDLEEILEVGCAVHLGRLVELFRHLFKILLEQINIEDTGHTRENQAGKGIAQSEIGDGDKVGDDDQLIGDHHQGEEEGKGDLPSRKVQTRERIRGEHHDHDHDHGGHAGVDQGIEEIAAERDRGERVKVVLQRWLKGEERGHILAVVGAVAFDGGQEHPVEREQNDHGPERQKEVTEDAAGHAPGLAGPAFLGNSLFFHTAHLTHNGHAGG